MKLHGESTRSFNKAHGTSGEPIAALVAPAQTNVQLYNQLCALKWRESELRSVHAAYELAMHLFAGQYRPNHKPFLAHLIGTASILAQVGSQGAIVSAGLLHSAYLLGDFGDGTRGVREANRRVVRHAVGAACESIVESYAKAAWSAAEMTAMAGGDRRLSPTEQVVALVRLADLLEDYYDHGMLYSPQKEGKDEASVRSAGCVAGVQLARRLGQNELADALTAAFEQPTDVRVPEFLRASELNSFLIAPPSHRIRTTLRLAKVYRACRAKLNGKKRVTVNEKLRRAA